MNVTSSKLGRAFHAIRTNESVAAAFGIDVTRYKLLAFTVSGALAGVAGAMYGHLYGNVNSEVFNYRQSLLLVIIVVLGGLGSRAGVAVAAAFYAFFPLVLDRFFETNLLDLIIGAALLMYTVSRHPGGLAEAFRHARERRAKADRATVGRGAADAAPSPSRRRRPRPTQMSTPATSSSARRRSPSTSAASPRLTDAGVEVPRGKIVGLIGPNGAGKTTLFNAISGRHHAGVRTHLALRTRRHEPSRARARAARARTELPAHRPREGPVRHREPAARAAPARRATTPPRPCSGSRAPRAWSGSSRERARSAIEALGFERYADTPVQNLSHGQQRIVEIGCLLVTAPEILMLDEPSAGMAPALVENLAERLKEMRDELGKTILLIEHNVPLVLDVCDELCVLDAGAVLAHGDPKQVVGDRDVVDAYLGRVYA